MVALRACMRVGGLETILVVDASRVQLKECAVRDDYAPSAERAGTRAFTILSGALYPRKLLLCSNKHGASRKFVTLIGLHNPADAHFAAIVVASR